MFAKNHGDGQIWLKMMMMVFNVTGWFGRKEGKIQKKKHGKLASAFFHVFFLAA